MQLSLSLIVIFMLCFMCYFSSCLLASYMCFNRYWMNAYRAYATRTSLGTQKWEIFNYDTHEIAWSFVCIVVLNTTYFYLQNWPLKDSMRVIALG